MALEIVRNDDYIEYFLFPIIDGSDEDEALSDIVKRVNEIAKSYVSNYIWHKDPFAVKARNKNSHLLNPESEGESRFKVSYSLFLMSSFVLVAALPAHLYGITHYGDNIQDEWFIVSLLFYLSRELPGLIVRCCDSDGEFMLIEAAEHLPQWANPETCEQRVSVLIAANYGIDSSGRVFHSQTRPKRRLANITDESFAS